MDGLHSTSKLHDSIWVIVDRMTKSSHLIPMKFTYRVEDYEKLYIVKIVRCNGSLYLAFQTGEPR